MAGGDRSQMRRAAALECSIVQDSMLVGAYGGGWGVCASSIGRDRLLVAVGEKKRRNTDKKKNLNMGNKRKKKKNALVARGTVAT